MSDRLAGIESLLVGLPVIFPDCQTVPLKPLIVNPLRSTLTVSGWSLVLVSNKRDLNRLADLIHRLVGRETV